MNDEEAAAWQAEERKSAHRMRPTGSRVGVKGGGAAPPGSWEKQTACKGLQGCCADPGPRRRLQGSGEDHLSELQVLNVYS